jgi:hypothetical protein
MASGTYYKRPDGKIQVNRDGMSFPTIASEDDVRRAGLVEAPPVMMLDPLEASRAATSSAAGKKEREQSLSEVPSGMRVYTSPSGAGPTIPDTGQQPQGLGGRLYNALSDEPTGQLPKDLAQKAQQRKVDETGGGQVEQARAMQAAGQQPTNIPTGIPGGMQAVPSPAQMQQQQRGPSYAAFGGSPGRRIPGGWQPSGRQTEETVYDEQALDNLRDAMRTEGVDDAVARQILSDGFGKLAQDKRKEAVMFGDRAAAARADIDQSLAALEADRSDIAAMRVDPNHIWADRGTFAQVLAALAMGAGEFAAIRSGSGRNTAAQIIENAINRDIDAQKANISLRQQGLQTKTTLLDRYMRNHDPETAERMARLAMNESVKAEAMQRQETADIVKIRSATESRIAQLDADLSKQRKATTEQYQPERVVGGSAPRKLDMGLMRKLGLVADDGSLIPSPQEAYKLQQQYYSGRVAQEAKGGPAEKPLDAGTRATVAKFSSGLDGMNLLIQEVEKQGATGALKNYLNTGDIGRLKQRVVQDIGFALSGANVGTDESKRELAQLHAGLSGALSKEQTIAAIRRAMVRIENYRNDYLGKQRPQTVGTVE